jgi:hypothetical protein
MIILLLFIELQMAFRPVAEVRYLHDLAMCIFWPLSEFSRKTDVILDNK